MVQSGLKKCFPQQKLATDGDEDGDLTVDDDAVINDKLTVGKGTSGETCKLHVKDGSASPPSWVAGKDQMVVEDNNYAIQQLCALPTGVAWLQFSDNVRCRGGIGYRFEWGDDDHEELAIYTGGAQKLAIDDEGLITYTPDWNEIPTANAAPLGISTDEESIGEIGWLDPSSIRYKENVRDVEDADISYLYSLRPVMYDYKAPLEGTNLCGLIAEEVELVAPQLVGYRMKITHPEPEPGQMPEDVDPIVTKTNEPNTVRYSKLIVPMLAELQKLRAEFEANKQRVAELKAR